jgi:DNA repair ATPase RecN
MVSFQFVVSHSRQRLIQSTKFIDDISTRLASLTSIVSSTLSETSSILHISEALFPPSTLDLLQDQLASINLRSQEVIRQLETFTSSTEFENQGKQVVWDMVRMVEELIDRKNNQTKIVLEALQSISKLQTQVSEVPEEMLTLDEDLKYVLSLLISPNIFKFFDVSS